MPNEIMNLAFMNPSLHYAEMLERVELEKENGRLRAALGYATDRESREGMVERAVAWLDAFVAEIDAPADVIAVRDCHEDAEGFLRAALGLPEGAV